MQNIPAPDAVDQALQQLAPARNQTLAELAAEMVAQQQWEEHAQAAYDAFHARPVSANELLTGEELFALVRDPQVHSEP
jgi:predicted transcriptional regulator